MDNIQIKITAIYLVLGNTQHIVHYTGLGGVWLFAGLYLPVQLDMEVGSQKSSAFLVC